MNNYEADRIQRLKDEMSDGEEPDNKNEEFMDERF